MLRKKTYEEMLATALGYLQNHTEITMVAPGSTARALTEANVAEVVSAYNMADMAMRMAYVSTATGYVLDLLGEMVGIVRRTEQYAYVRGSDRNIRFYVSSGVLGDFIPKSGDPTKCEVPAGTTISSLSGGIVFVTDVAHEAPAAATEIWVSARAQTVGTDANVGPSTLISHSLTDQVQVENVSAVTTGSEVESDESLRYRIRTATVVAEGANRTAIEDAAIQVAGVADVVVQEYSQGAGSFDILLLPDGNRVPFDALLQVRSRLASTVAFGVNFTVREPRYVAFAIDMEIDMPRAPDTEKPLLRDLVAGRIGRYIGSLRPEETLRVGRLREAALGVSTLVSDVHIRSMRIGGRPQLVADYTLANDEILIPDPEETSPFQVI
jgi:uncharacterized phage protein gp47/JayE